MRCSGNNSNKPTKPIRPWRKACRRHERRQSRGTRDSGGNLRWEGGEKRDRGKEGEICSVCFYPNPQFKENLSLIQPNETQLWNLCGIPPWCLFCQSGHCLCFKSLLWFSQLLFPVKTFQSTGKKSENSLLSANIWWYEGAHVVFSLIQSRKAYCIICVCESLWVCAPSSSSMCGRIHYFSYVCIYNGDIFNLFATLFITEPADHMAVSLSRRWIPPEMAASKPVCDLCGARPPSCEALSPSCGPSLTGECSLQPEPSFQTHHHLSPLWIKAQRVTWVTPHPLWPNRPGKCDG